ncbi:hypothetical protein JXA85_03480 [Candidatus Woesearchaeota archaeon]|nr:hypothetical protein [Candidatus Woesearchaeota archaeon]
MPKRGELMKDKLVEYAEKQLKKKVNPARIKQRLISVGNDPEHVEHAVSHAMKKKWHHVTIAAFTIFILIIGFLLISNIHFPREEEPFQPVQLIQTMPAETPEYVQQVVNEMIESNDENICLTKLTSSGMKQFCMDNYYLNKALNEDNTEWCSHIFAQNIKDVCIRS